MAHDVFISYSSIDEQVAETVCDYLEKNNISCWMASRDVIAGEDWVKEIVRAITRSKLIFLIFSSNSNESSQIEREINIASEKNIPILPFRVDNIEPSEGLIYYIGRRNWLNAFSPPLEKHLEHMLKSVRKFVVENTDAFNENISSERSRHQQIKETADFQPDMLQEMEASKGVLTAAIQDNIPGIDKSSLSNSFWSSIFLYKKETFQFFSIAAIIWSAISVVILLSIIQSFDREKGIVIFCLLFMLFIGVGLVLAYASKLPILYGIVSGGCAFAFLISYFVVMEYFRLWNYTGLLVYFCSFLTLIGNVFAVRTKASLIGICAGILAGSWIVGGVLFYRDTALISAGIIGLGLTVFAVLQRRNS
jgi:hypothetical protein